MKTVKFVPDPHQKPTLKDFEEVKLDSLSDEEIDYSDIEELDDDFWQNVEMVSLDLTQPVMLKAS
jgi:hypothetical protein